MENFDFLKLFTFSSLVRFASLIVIGLPFVFFVSKWVREYATKKFSSQQGMVFSKIVFYIGLFIITFAMLNELGFKLTHLLGAAGIVGIAIGFASQTSVSNIISGLFLIAEKPFQVDDVIKVGETSGVVLSIDTLSVKLRTFDNRFVRIPNESLIKTEFTNITKFPIRRVDINIGVAYKEDVKKVREVLLDIAYKNPLVLNDPEPLVIFNGFGNSSLDFLFAIWAVKTDWLKVKNTVMDTIKKRFDEEGIEIPFPHISFYAGSVTDPLPINIVDSSIKKEQLLEKSVK